MIIGNLRSYAIFCSVAKHENISRAAEELYLTQPVVTRAIQSLEASLHVTLLLRTSKGVQLTESGYQLYQQVAPAFESIEKAESDLLKRENSAQIITIYVNSLASQFLIQECEKQLPEDIHIVSSIVDVKSTCKALLDEEIEMAVVFDQGFQKEWEDISLWLQSGKIQQISLGEHQDCFMVGQHIYHKEGNKININRLKKYPFILAGYDSKMNQQYCSQLRENGLLETDYIINGMENRVSLVTHNFGFSFFPLCFAQQEIKQKLLYPIQTGIETMTHPAYILVNCDHHLSDEAIKIIALLKDFCGEK